MIQHVNVHAIKPAKVGLDLDKSSQDQRDQ